MLTFSLLQRTYHSNWLVARATLLAVLTAPPGFSYLWSTGATTQSITVLHPTTGQIFSCTITAANGCNQTIYQTVSYTAIHSNFTHGLACAGKNTQFTDSTWLNQNSVVNWKWNLATGLQVSWGCRIHCILFPIPEDYNVSLKSYSTEGCVDSITKIRSCWLPACCFKFTNV